jgi:hypothetical protein
LPKILPRLIQIETISHRRALLAAGKVFAGNYGSELGGVSKSRDPVAGNTDEYEDDLFNSREREGNLRQRRYRFDKVSQWLLSTFTKEAAKPLPKKK